MKYCMNGHIRILIYWITHVLIFYVLSYYRENYEHKFLKEISTTKQNITQAQMKFYNLNQPNWIKICIDKNHTHTHTTDAKYQMNNWKNQEQNNKCIPSKAKSQISNKKTSN